MFLSRSLPTAYACTPADLGIWPATGGSFSQFEARRGSAISHQVCDKFSRICHFSAQTGNDSGTTFQAPDRSRSGSGEELGKGGVLKKPEPPPLLSRLLLHNNSNVGTNPQLIKEEKEGEKQDTTCIRTDGALDPRRCRRADPVAAPVVRA